MPETYEITDIADKTTLDNVKSDTTALKSRGGIKANGDDLYGFNPTTNTWHKIDFSRLSGANPTLIIINDNGAMDNIDITVSRDSWFEVTQTMENDYDTFVLPALGTYTVSYESGGSTISTTVNVSAIGGITLTLPTS